jgi:hypothetical protein
MFYPINTLNWAMNSYGIFSMDVDFVGQDLSNSVQPSFTSCLALCSATTNCTHLSYRYSSGNNCYLKSGPRSQSNAVKSIGLQAAILNQS